jgi:hypothetical protein
LRFEPLAIEFKDEYFVTYWGDCRIVEVYGAESCLYPWDNIHYTKSLIREQRKRKERWKRKRLGTVGRKVELQLCRSPHKLILEEVVDEGMPTGKVNVGVR